MTAEGERLKNVQAKHTKQNADLELARRALEEEIVSLKQEKVDLHRQVVELKQAVS